MIYVTVGTHTQGFPRLVKKMDEIAARIKEQVIMQIGTTDYVPRHASFFRISDEKQIESYVRKARLIVTHAGAGSIISSLNQGKIPIVVPRRKEFHEHVDDHQVEMARAFEKEGKVIAVYALDNLETSLVEKHIKKTEKTPLIEEIRAFLSRV